MVRRRNKLVWIIGIPVIAFGLAKGGMYLYVKQKLDHMIMEAAPRFTIQYADLETSLQGRVIISGINVVPVGQSDAFNISRVSIKGPDPLTYMLNHNPVTGDKGPPEYLDMSINNLNMNLSGSLASNLDESYRLSLEQETGSASGVCSSSGSLSLGMLREMGHETLAGDMRLFYRYAADARRLNVSLESSIKGIQSMFLQATLSGVSPYALKSGSPGIPSLADFRLTSKIPPVFGKNMSEYCAGQTGQTLIGYEEQAAATFMQNLAESGIVLGWGLQMAVRSYYSNWGEIDIVAKPAKPVNLLGLMFSPPQNIEQALGLQVSVNGRLLTDLNFKLQKDARLFSKQSKKRKRGPAIPRIRFKNVWDSVSPANLRHHQYKDVKLHLAGRPSRSGTLVGLENGSVLVEQRIDGGKFTAHVPMGTISSAEVKNRVQIKPPPSAPEKGQAEKTEPEQAKAPAQQG